MANSEHIEILKRGVQEWNAWRRQDPGVEPDLSRVDLSRIELAGANLKFVSFRAATLSRAILRGANLRGARLYQTEFYRADLTAAELNGADLRGAKLHETDLTGASLENAQLFRVDFIQTILDQTRFAGAICALTTFGNVDLRTAEGLERVVHSGPSNIDVSTLLRSMEGAPQSFLIASGIPEPFLRHISTYRSSPEQFLSCFISYATEDQRFAERLFKDLQSHGIRCWFAPHDMEGGRTLYDQIEAAISKYDKLLLILSDSSMNSGWVQTEIAAARAREQQQKRKMLFPIAIVAFEQIRSWKSFDADTGSDVAREIRQYYVPDFSNWTDPGAYSTEFARLVRDLKAPHGG